MGKPLIKLYSHLLPDSLGIEKHMLNELKLMIAETLSGELYKLQYFLHSSPTTPFPLVFRGVSLRQAAAIRTHQHLSLVLFEATISL
jgi:hypothetical protein